MRRQFQREGRVPFQELLEPRTLLSFSPIGGEFRANSTTANSQSTSSVAMDANGDFVVAWMSYGQDESASGIYAQRYNAAGAAVGSEFRVNTFINDGQSVPSAGMDANGDFVIAWMSNGQDGSNYGIYAQRYSAAGAAVGSEFRVNTFTSGNQTRPSVAVDADGDFVIAWMSDGEDGSGHGVYAQRYSAAGAAVGGEFRVNTFTTGTQTLPQVAMDANGDFVITWISAGQDGSSYGIFAQRYNTAGAAVGGEFRVNTFISGSQSVPEVAMDAGGDLVIAWGSSAQDGSDYGIYAQRYSTAGAAVGGEFRVNTFTTGNQSNPSVSMNGDGDFVIAWQSSAQDGSDYGIYAQRYSAAGAAVGREFRVNTFSTASQNNPSVSMDGAGDFVIAWESGDQDGSQSGIYAQRYGQTGTVSGKLFDDKNANRRLDSGETPLFKWRVFNDANNDGVWNKSFEEGVLSDRLGRWKLQRIPFGTQRIRVVLKRGWKYTIPKNRVLEVKLNASHSSLSNRLFGIKRI
jgi:hypothetical protein